MLLNWISFCSYLLLMPQTFLSVASGDIYVSWCMIMTFNRVHPREGIQKECKHIWNLKGGTVKSGKARQQDGWITRRELSAVCDNNVGTHAPSAALLLLQMLFATGHSWCFSTGDLYRRDWAKEKAVRSAVEENFSAKKNPILFWEMLRKVRHKGRSASRECSCLWCPPPWMTYVCAWLFLSPMKAFLHASKKPTSSSEKMLSFQLTQAHTHTHTCKGTRAVRKHALMCMCAIEEAQGAS